MQMSNEEKKELLNHIRELVEVSCRFQCNSTMLQSIDNLSSRMLGCSLTEEEKSAILSKHSQTIRVCEGRLLRFLEIDFANDPFWKEEEWKAKENVENFKKILDSAPNHTDKVQT